LEIGEENALLKQKIDALARKIDRVSSERLMGKAIDYAFDDQNNNRCLHRSSDPLCGSAVAVSKAVPRILALATSSFIFRRIRYS